MKASEIQTVTTVISESVALQRNETSENEEGQTEAEATLEAHRTDILSAVENFFASENKEVDLEHLIEPAPILKFTKKEADGSSVAMEIPGGMTSKSYINGNIVVSMSTVNVYSNVLTGEGISTTFVFQYQDRRFQELFYEQVIESTSIGLSLGFNFSAISPTIPKVPTTIEEKGKAKSKDGNSEFNMNLNFAQQKFKQQMELRKDFFTMNSPVMMISTDLKTGHRVVHNVQEEKKKVEAKQL